MPQSLFRHIASPVERLAAHILERLDYFGGSLSKRELQRKLNSHKYPLWGAAWELLISNRCIEVTQLRSRRQAVVRLVGTPGWLQVQDTDSSPRKRRRRRRPRTEWFDDHLADFLRRDGYEEQAREVEEEA